MTPHTKPTEEELDSKINEALEIPEEELNKQQEEPEVEEPNIEEIEKEAGIEKEEPEVEEPKKEPEQAEPSKEVKEQLKKELKEKKEKLSASARENQKIYAKNRVLNQAIIDTDEIPEPTEDDLKAQYKDWEVMSDVERELAKETVISKNWRAKIKEAQDQAKKIEKWNDSVDEFTEDPETLINYGELEGKVEEFKNYAKADENNSVPFKVLVGAFLHDQSTKKVEHNGAMFERGGGGSNEKPQLKTTKISLDESRKLRETNYPKWKELLLAEKIDQDL
jgi:hypothetical protein